MDPVFCVPPNAFCLCFCNLSVLWQREGVVILPFTLQLRKLSYNFKGHDFLRTINEIMANIC